MICKIQLFASLKENLGETIDLPVEEPVTVRAVLDTFVRTYPEYETARKSLSVAVDLEYGRPQDPIREGAEIAIFPPVSGG